jgi:DNA-binding transcriptional ArsR family regulator
MAWRIPPLSRIVQWRLVIRAYEGNLGNPSYPANASRWTSPDQVHPTIKTTPAIRAGTAKDRWTIEDMVDLLALLIYDTRPQRARNQTDTLPKFDRRSRRRYISLVGEIANNPAMNELFQALSDPTRREILRLLKSGDMTAGDIADRFALAKSTLSGHFSVLKHAGLIVAEKNGTSIVYSLNVSAAEQALAAIMNLLEVGKPRATRSKT